MNNLFYVFSAFFINIIKSSYLKLFINVICINLLKEKWKRKGGASFLLNKYLVSLK